MTNECGQSANVSPLAAASAPAAADAGIAAPVTGRFLPGRRLAAPSWVIPGGIRENLRFLTGRVDEVGLLFFATAASLAYGVEDLPEVPRTVEDLPEIYDGPGRCQGSDGQSGACLPWPSSAPALPLPSFHIHLPTDLPWCAPREAARICAALTAKTAYLGELRAVLHPPALSSAGSAGARKQTAAFFDACRRQNLPPWRFLLENIERNDLLPLLPLCDEYDLRICLDLGHALAYSQDALLDAEPILRRTEMVHLSAPGAGAEKGRHLPLTRLSREDRRTARRLVRAVPQAMVMLELFSWTDIEGSLPLIQEWLRD